MLYSCAGQFRLKLPCLFFAAALLLGCGSGDHGAVDTAAPATQTGTIPENDDQQLHAPTANITITTNEGGYVINDSRSIFCDVEHEFCDTNAALGSIESLTAISRFGHSLKHWQQDGSALEETRSDLLLIADTNVSIAASFQKQEEIANPVCIAPPEAARFRTLHLGDSLTDTQCWGNCRHYYFQLTDSPPLRESVHYYILQLATNAVQPRVISAGGERINGTNLYMDQWSESIKGFNANHLWQTALITEGESLDDFDAVVIALGTNDLVDVDEAHLSIADIVNERIKPLLEWIGNKPVVWLLPHYINNRQDNPGFTTYSTPEGMGCGCNPTDTATAGCQLAQALEQCDLSPQMQNRVKFMFASVNELRQRIYTLQNEYPNLHVIDPATVISQASNGNYDLFQHRRDAIHFDAQGSEWYAWTHAYAAQLTNPACGDSLAPTSMSPTEIAMGEALGVVASHGDVITP
jgi:hypothetical protein